MLKNLFSNAQPAAQFRAPLKLNLGCGYRKLEGYVNADKYPDSKPDLLLDLEVLPWPFPDNSATHVFISHVLEHIGQSSALFLSLMQELYRVCAPQAEVSIRVPHPRHDDFLGDPTHVRPIMPATLQAFDQALNREWIAGGSGNTPIGLQLGVDFQVVSLEYLPDPRWRQKLDAGQVTAQELMEASFAQNNVIAELIFTCVAHKPGRG